MGSQKLQKFRRERLQAAADKAGGKAALGKLLGYRDGAFIGQMLREERPITEDTVMKLEGKPGFRGWFDPQKAQLDNGEPTPAAGGPIESAVALVAAVMQQADEVSRQLVAGLLARVATNPDDQEQITAAVSKLVGHIALPTAAEPLVEVVADADWAHLHERIARITDQQVKTAAIRLAHSGVTKAEREAPGSSQPPRQALAKAPAKAHREPVATAHGTRTPRNTPRGSR